MDPEYEEFLEHPQFFVKPGTLRPDDGAFDSSVPHEWIVERGDEWTYLMPPNSSTPTQGWKIHVSTTMAEASEVLAIVATLCVDRGIAFKHLKSPARLFWRNSKSCAREHSGKFVACYPHDDEAAELASALDAALAGRRGPYILSDRRWASAPVYIRYGAFKFIPLPDEDDLHPLWRGRMGRSFPMFAGPSSRFPTGLRSRRRCSNGSRSLKMPTPPSFLWRSREPSSSPTAAEHIEGPRRTIRHGHLWSRKGVHLQDSTSSSRTLSTGSPMKPKCSMRSEQSREYPE